jgi:phosphoglycerate dehydrogenase-like enzyme
MEPRPVPDNSKPPTNVMIASPLEPPHVQRIVDVFGDRITVAYDADLLPVTRYVADHKGDPAWRRTPTQQRRWLTMLAEAEVLWDFPIGESAPLLSLAPRLRWLQTTSAGVGPMIRQLKIDQTDVLVTTASGVHARPLAEFVFAVLLYHTKRLAHLEGLRTTHRWERFSTASLVGRTIAIIGMGRIGTEVAKVAHAFDMRVWGMSRRTRVPADFGGAVDRMFRREQLHDMLAGADCVVLCVPQTPDTDDLIGEAQIAVMKHGVVFINIGRGTTVDEPTLLAALKNGKIGIAGLDVFKTEPLPPSSPFWDMPNVLVNPHSASTADSENGLLTERFIDNLAKYLAGDYAHMAPIFNKTEGY